MAWRGWACPTRYGFTVLLSGLTVIIIGQEETNDDPSINGHSKC